MQLRFRVHGANLETVMRPATLQDGRTIEAGFGALCVELVEVDGPNAQTIRVIPDDAAALAQVQTLFAVDSIVTLTFAPEIL